MILRHSRTVIGILNEILDVSNTLFCLRNTFGALVTFSQTLIAEITDDFRWFDQRPVETEQLAHALRALLRFLNKNFTFVNSQRIEVVFIKKALVYSNLNKLKSEYSFLKNKVKDIMVGTELAVKLEHIAYNLFKTKKVIKLYFMDYTQIIRDAKHTFEHLQVHYPPDVMKVAKHCEGIIDLEPNTRFSNYSLFDKPEFVQATYVFSSFLLALDPQIDDKRFLSKLDLNKVKVDKVEVGGVFGNIQNVILPFRESEEDTTGEFSLHSIKPSVLEKISGIGKLKFVSELSIMLQYKHHGLINLLGFTLSWGWLCIAMEPVEKNLREHIDGSERSEKVRIGKRESLTLLKPVVEALDYMHSFGIIHNNIRPENIFFCRAGNHLSTKLANLDYGLSTEESTWKTLQRDTFVWYRAPEILNFSESTAASDIYSLAITLWEVLQSNHGQKPYDHIAIENKLPRAHVIKKVREGERPPLQTEDDDPKKHIPDWARELLISSWSPVTWERPTPQSWITYIENLQESNFFESAKKQRPESIHRKKKAPFALQYLKKKFQRFKRKRAKQLPAGSHRSGSMKGQMRTPTGPMEGSPRREMSKTLRRITTTPDSNPGNHKDNAQRNQL